MKKFKVLLQKSKQIELEVSAESEEKVTEVMDDILEKIDLFELDGMEISNEFTEMEIEEIDEEEEKENEELEENLEEKTCQNCPYFCSGCGKCIFQE